MNAKPEKRVGCILIGPPGAGKTTVGGLLARRLDGKFLDSDHLIEAKSGKTIAQIFVDDGEAKFREIEEAVVLNLLKAYGETDDADRFVIALGGGSILSSAVSQALAKRNDVVYLDVSLSSAAPRVGFNRERPLLLINPRQQWQELMNRRRPIYQSLATLTVDTNEKSPEEVVEEIERWVDAA